MDNWTDGYVTELPYSVNHFPEMAPAHLNLAFLQAGLAAPDIQASFNYLELGFGQGLGLNLLAATHPQGEFFGNDFMPAHVLAAQGLADCAGLDNLHLYEDSFALLLTRELPPMDFIVLHGVYSWVNAENRAHVVALIAKLLKPEGVVYISYNCLPGWSVKAPMQRLMSEFAQRQSEGSALERYHAARDLLGELDTSDAAFFTHNPAARTMLRDIANASDAYLLHEFAPAGWSPFYHADVAQDLVSADLRFACSAKLFNNFPAYSLPAKTRDLLAATPDVGLREMLRDFAVQTQFRRDVFVRSARSLSAEALESQRGALRLSLWRPLAACAMTCQTPAGEMRLEDDLYRPLLQSLAAAPQSVEALLALPEVAAYGRARSLAAVEMLLCLGYVGIAQSVTATSRTRIHALNRALIARLVAGERLSGLASVSLGAAIEVSYHDLLFIAAQQAGCTSAEQIAAFAQTVLTPAANATEDLAQRGKEAANFLKYGDAFYQSLEFL